MADPNTTPSEASQGKESAVEEIVPHRDGNVGSIGMNYDEIGIIKETWGSKISFLLTLVGYAVGLGNIWRFPYLLQENGGVVFLIPYTISVFFVGVPIFYLELAIGQRLRKGPIGCWQEVSPYLGGIGIMTGVTCFLYVSYYSCLTGWVISYIFDSFRPQLLYESCETAVKNDLPKHEISQELKYCEAAGPSQYYWFRRVLNVSTDITTPGAFNWWVLMCLGLAWIIIYGILVKGLVVIEKVVYFTAVFPYIILLIFFVNGLTLENMSNGYNVLFTPKWEVLLDPKCWKAAAAQIFVSLGIGYGCLISFSSYMKPDNDCHYDAIFVATANYLTSMLTTLTMFPYLGYYGTKLFEACKIERQYTLLKNLGFDAEDNVQFPEDGLVTSYIKDGIPYLIGEIPDLRSNHTFDISTVRNCTLRGSIEASASGTGLVFIIFTEAITTLKFPQIWAVLFFFMLLNLGIDSAFGTLEGTIASLCDIFPRTKKWIITTIVCGACWFMATSLFSLGWAQYVLTYMDDFTANWPILMSGILECAGMAWVYGLRRFARDLTIMTGSRPSVYWLFCWKYISPLILTVILIFNVVDLFQDGIPYRVWDEVKGQLVRIEYPLYLIILGFFLTSLSVAWVPLIAILRFFGVQLIKYEPPAEFPEAELIEEHAFKEGDEFRRDSATKIVLWGSLENRESEATIDPKIDSSLRD